MSHRLTLSNCIKYGFSNAAYIRTNEVEFLEDVRRMCEDNRCGQYGRNWMCPPACGTLGEIHEKITSFDYGVLLQVTENMEDDFDVEAMERAEKKCKRSLHELNDALNKESVFCEVLVLGAGTCDICTTCCYPDAPCRFPHKAIASLEACGMLVSRECEKAGIPYYYGPKTITFTGAVFIRE